MNSNGLLWISFIYFSSNLFDFFVCIASKQIYTHYKFYFERCTYQVVNGTSVYSAIQKFFGYCVTIINQVLFSTLYTQTLRFNCLAIIYSDNYTALQHSSCYNHLFYHTCTYLAVSPPQSIYLQCHLTYFHQPFGVPESFLLRFINVIILRSHSFHDDIYFQCVNGCMYYSDSFDF